MPPRGHDHAAHGRRQRPADPAAARSRRSRTSTTTRRGRPAEGFERYAFTALRQHRHRHRLRAAPRRRLRIRWRHRRLASGRVLGICRFRRLHACARAGPAAGTARDARRRTLARQIWWVATVAATAAGLALIAFRGTAGVVADRRRAHRRAAHRRRAAARQLRDRPIPGRPAPPVRRGGDGDQPDVLGAAWRLSSALSAQRFLARCGPASATTLPDRRSLTFVLGGARSGKSAHAEKLVTASPRPGPTSPPAQAFDDEMTERIALSPRAPRRGLAARSTRRSIWPTRFGALPDGRPVLVDCLTLWLTNHHAGRT